MKHLTLNPDHHAKILSLGYKIEEFNLESRLNEWFNRLFRLDASVQLKYESFLKETYSSDLVCAQIRLGDSKDLSFMKRNSTKLYWRLIREKFLPNLENFKIFVTTDTQDVVNEAIDLFGHRKIIAFKDHSGFHSDKLQEKECGKMRGILLDFMILGNCKMAAISHSGFGLLGVLNREDTKDLTENVYVYANPKNVRENFWNRTNLSFHKYTSSLLYLEYV